jgi:hypothetical protein
MTRTSGNSPEVGVDATPEEVASFRDAQAKEWGTYVALDTITYNGVVQFNAGNPVPVDIATRLGYVESGQVGKVGTKAVNEVIARLHATATEIPGPQAPPVTLGVNVS